MTMTIGGDIGASDLLLSFDAGNPKSYISGSSTWNDLSGNGHSAALVDVGFANGKGLICDGSTSTITVSNFTIPTGNYSVVMWAQSYVALGDHTSTAPRVTMYKNDAYWHPGLWMTGRTQRPHRPPQYRDNLYAYDPYTRWFMIGQAWDGTNVYNILDGQLILGDLISDVYESGQGTTLTIAYESGQSATLNGEVAIFMIYNKFLTSEDIGKIYNVQRARFGI